MIGQTISHYRITEKLGEGGMGMVYKAEDTKLDRPVALKFLAPHLLRDAEARKRFEREAKAAAKLDHPNICTVYEIDEVDGRTFIVMAFLEGRPLSERIQEGPLKLTEALSIAVQMAEGLGAAHEKGITHRDIKPDNVMLTSGSRGLVKLMDFGLAQLASADSKLTREGTTLGTCAYMSPEQTTAEEVDARTDVWASGCVLYEMLASDLPFRGHYEQAIVYSILNEDPEPLGISSVEVEAVIRRCLAKKPEERYRDGKALLEALQEIHGSPRTSTAEAPVAPSKVPRVAVLPLKTRTGNAEIESFAEGLTEEITSGLSQFRHLIVVSSSAAARFKGPTDLGQVGRQLDARFLLEGSARKTGSSIRVSVQLVDARTGAHLWAERFDRDLGSADILAVQDELTDRIVGTVADPFGVLTRSLGAIAKAKPIDTLTAHECVLRTFSYYQHVLPDEHAEMRMAVERALEREPNHADARACLSLLYLDEFKFDFNARPDALGRALHTAQRAVELDATSQLAYRSLAEAHYYRRELGAFRPTADRVLSLNPRDTSNVGMIGILIAYSGDWTTGRSVVEKVMQLNPHHAGWLHFVFVVDHYRKREYERALEAAEKLNMPGHFWVSLELAMINAQLGWTEAARKHLKTFIELAPDVARNPRAEFSKWWVSEEFVEHRLDGLRKAGLDIDGAGETAPAATKAAPAAPSEVPRVAVLPLKTRDAELESFGEGLTEEITSGLSQFRHLVVVSASAAAGFQGQADVRGVSKELGARFVLEGSIRKAGSSIRVSVQLLDAATGAHLWAERFDRDLSATDLFAVQDELTDRIVATVADPFGVLTRSLGAIAKAKPVETLTAHECVLLTFAYWQQMRPDEHAEVRAALEQALEREPDHPEALSCLSWLYLDEFRFDFNVRPDALDRALDTAQRAVEVDATSQLAYRALAEAHYFRRELSAFRPAADRVLSLNPRDTSTVGMIGNLIGVAGDWTRGCSVVRKVMQLNPHHAGWLHFVLADDHYRKGEYEQALEAAEKVNMPGHFWESEVLAAINAQLGRTEEARKHLERFVELAPDVARNIQSEHSKWYFSQEFVEHRLDGLRKAGLDVDGDGETTAATPVAATVAAPTAPSEVPRVAVLPLKTRAGDADIESFADGLTEEITAGLSQFRHLVVVSASAAAGFQGQADVREVSKELGARFVLEGSIRKAGSSVRVSVQLLDASTGAHLWAERFDRDRSATDLFAVQDELTDRIVATVADPFGVLTRSLGAVAKAKPVDTLTAYECVLRTFAYWQQVVPDEHAEVRAALEQALQREPDHTEALACLSRVYLDEFRFDFNARPDTLDRALRTAQRAVELDATSQLAYRALAEAHYYRRELNSFRPAADRVLSLNPRDTSNIGMIGCLIAFAGDWPTGRSAVQKVMQLNPHHAGWLHFVFVADHYRRREYERALEAAEKINMPGHFWVSADLAAINAQLGRSEAARKHLKTFVELAPDVAKNVRAEFSKSLASAELVEHFVDGLRKAGLDVDGDGETAAPASAETRQPFVGRQAEQDKLAARLVDVSQGRGALALIGGEPGVGKTRLSEELLADARERGMLTFTGHCYEEGTAPFTPFVEILEQMVRELPADVLREALGDAAPDVVRLVPEIHRVVDDIPPPAELTPEQQRRVLFNAVLDLFRRLGARQPVVLLLDDLHWADEATLGLLQHLAPHLAGIRLLVLGTYRDVELDVGKPFEKAMAALVRQKQAERLRLRRLPQEAVAELLTALGGSQPPGTLVQLIFHETEGNPFFVGEVFQHLSEEGKLFDEAGEWKEDLSVDELDVPEGVRLVIGRRLERLSEATPKLLTAAAVVGRRFDLKLVEALSDLDTDGFLDAIEEAETAKLIVSEREGRETSCVFTHELIRNTLLQALSLPRRQRLHARVAAAMEDVYESDLTRRVSALAHHLYEAGSVADEAKTIHYLILAGEQSLETGAFEEARRDFDLAMSLLPADDRENRASLLWKRGLAHRSLGLWKEAIDDWETALPIYEELADRQGISSICQELVHHHVWTAQPTQSVEAAKRGLGALPPEPSADRCRLLGHCAWALGFACDLESADAMMQQALAMAEELSDPRLQGEVFLLSSWRHYHCNRRREQMEATGRAVELLRPTRALDKLADALANRQWSSVLAGRPDEVARTQEETRALAERLGLLDAEAHARISEGQRDWLASADLEALESYLHQVMTLMDSIGGQWSFIGEAWQSQSSLWRGRPEEARARAQSSLNHEPRANLFTGNGWGQLFLCECSVGHADSALALLDERRDGLPRAGRLNGPGAWQALFKTVEGLALLGERDRAAELYPLTVEAIATDTVLTIDASHLLQTVAGIAAAAGRRWDEALSHYETAIRLSDEIPCRSEQAEARYWFARMLVDRNAAGDREGARDLLDTALAVYREIGMPQHVEMAEELLKQSSA